MTAPRVLYSFPTRVGTAGIGTTAWHQVAGLVEQGAEVTLACGSLERPLPGLSRLVQTMRLGGHRVPYRAIGLERALRHHDRRVAALVSRDPTAFDVVHAWPLGAERTLAAARASGLTGLLERPNAHTAYAFAAVSAECARLGIEIDPDSPHAFDARRLAREEREYDEAAYLVCPSEFVRQTFIERGVPPERLLRHRYGFDPARCSPPAVPPPGPFSVAFVGRGEPRKGLHLALEAWRTVGLGSTCRFVVCGEIEPGYRARIADLLAQPGVEQSGPVDDPAAVMRSCHALVLPSLEEGSALVTYEARACGCVPVVSDRTGAVAEPGVNALVHPAGDVTALSGDLARLARDPKLRGRLRSAGLARLDELSWSAAARRLVEVYAEAAGLTPAPRASAERVA